MDLCGKGGAGLSEKENLVNKMKSKYIIKKRAEICPVCKGEGVYKEKKCHGCDGNGWILIDESYWEYPDYYYPDSSTTFPLKIYRL